MLSTPVRRNEPCPCGSGRRYKDCHGSVATRSADGIGALLRDAQEAMQRNAYALAAARLEAAIALEPGRGDLHAALARAQFGTGDLAAAARSARTAVSVGSMDADAWNALGLALEATAPAEALAAWERAALLAPTQPEAHFRIGNLHRRHGRHDAAIAAYRRALASQPRNPVLLNNLGLAQQAQGELDAAERSYRAAIEAAPAMPEAGANLAGLLQQQRRFAEAATWFERALARTPRASALWSGLGTCHYRLGDHARARESFARALECGTGDARTMVDLASMLLAERRFVEALPLLERARLRDPASAEAENALLFTHLEVCQWNELTVLFERQRQRIRRHDGPPISPHNLLALPYTPAEQLIAARDWVERQIGAKPTLRPATPPRRGGRLRIGYLGSDFRSHPLANLLTEVIEAHDRSRFDVLGYSFGPDDRSAERARFVRAFDRFVDVRGESFAATAERIRNDGVAVLFDTGGHVLYARGEIFALRPAPIQINAWGFPGTLGADYYDYVLTDRFVTPEAQQAHFTERFLYLPHCYLPGDTKRPIGSAPTRAQAGLPEDGFVYCCFNGSYKIQPELFGVWMRLLAGVPESVLWLLDTDPLARANLRREAGRRNVTPERLVFAPRVAVAEHLARHALADVFLDTFPCNAHTTANDALFAGLPLVTCAGETFASRVSGSHLHAIGLPELVTRDLAEYEELALRLARDPESLAALRARLRTNRTTHPLFDTRAYARALEALLLGAVEKL